MPPVAEIIEGWLLADRQPAETDKLVQTILTAKDAEKPSHDHRQLFASATAELNMTRRTFRAVHG